MYKIYYSIKNTTATTNYMSIEQKDQEYLINSIISMSSYMNELSLCPDKDVKEIYRWYIQPNKKLPYNKNYKKHNSPQSFIGGILNNFLYGSQKDLSDIQAGHLQEILTMYSSINDCMTELKINLQKDYRQEPILFVENLWIT